MCLMCGTSLEEEPGADEQKTAPPRRLRRVQVIILVVVAVIILAASVVLGWRLSQEDVGSALPTYTATATRPPTDTPIPTITATPMPTPTPTITPSPVPPQTYVVQAGDNLLSIALKFDLTVAELQVFNNLESDTIIEGQNLLIPPPTPTPGPTLTLRPDEPTSTPAPYISYTVKSGDTLSTIAEQYGVPMDDIRQANEIPQDSETIKADQVLVIPQYTPTPETQSEILTSGTPAPRDVYPPPVLLYPAEGTIFNGADALIVLQWVSVGILEEREFYEVEIIIPTVEGKKTIQVYTRSTAWRISPDLFPSPEIADRECAWRVSVVRQITESADSGYKIISRLDKRRTFTWGLAQP